MITVNINNVEEAGNGPNLIAPGGYVGKIVNVNNMADRQGLVVELDVAEGPEAGHFQKLNADLGFWALSSFRSYKERALPFFKKFVKSVERSNEGYTWDGDENKLVGKLIGMVLQHEEYEGNDGKIKTKVTVNSFDSIAKIRNGEFKIPEKKILEKSNRNNEVVVNSASGFQPLNDDDIPFA